AHRTWREGRIKRAPAIERGILAAGVFEAIHFRVMNHTAVLDALVVAAADDASVADEDGADGNAARGEAFAGLLESGFEEWVWGHQSDPATSRVAKSSSIWPMTGPPEPGRFSTTRARQT